MVKKLKKDDKGISPDERKKLEERPAKEDSFDITQKIIESYDSKR